VIKDAHAEQYKGIRGSAPTLSKTASRGVLALASAFWCKSRGRPAKRDARRQAQKGGTQEASLVKVGAPFGLVEVGHMAVPFPQN
jgi:hypothetical protein